MLSPPYEHTLRVRELNAVRDAARQQKVPVRTWDPVTYRLTFSATVSSFNGPKEHLQTFHVRALQGVLAVSYGSGAVHISPHSEPYAGQATLKRVEIPTVLSYTIAAVTEGAKALVSIGTFNELHKFYFRLIDMGLVDPIRHID